MIHHVSRIRLEWTKPVSVFFFGDLQWGVSGFDEEAWAEFRREVIATPRSYCIGLGDYGDWLRPTMRSRVYGALSHDDGARRQQDDMVRREQDKLLDKVMGWMEGRLLGLHDGHHQWDFADGSNSTQRLCSALKAPYLGWIASTRLVLVQKPYGDKKSPGSRVCTIVSMHGTGSARAATTDARWLEANIVPAFVADIYAKGHSCKSVSWSPFERQHIRRAGPVGMDKITVRCLNVGGFSGGYTNGWESSYVERAGFSPQARGWAVVRFRRTQRSPGVPAGRSGNGYLDIEALSRFPSIRD